MIPSTVCCLWASAPWEPCSVRSWAELAPGAGGLWPWGWAGCRGWAQGQLCRQLRRAGSSEEPLVSQLRRTPREGEGFQQPLLVSPLSIISLPFSFSLSGFLLSVSRFPQQQGHKIHSLAFRSLMGRPSVCTVVLLLTYFCKAGIFPS